MLDEADEMLDMGFREDIESVLADCPEDRQTVFFSATMPKPILDLTKRYQRNPQLVKVTKNEVTNANIEQSWYAVRPDAKFEAMCRLIDFHQIKLMLVFSNQKARVDEIVEQFQMRGYAAEGLHGDMRQAARNQVMSKFRGGTTQILVATDVAARGDRRRRATAADRNVGCISLDYGGGGVVGRHCIVASLHGGHAGERA